MFLVLFTLMRKDDSVHGIIQVHGFTGRLFLRVSEAMSGLFCPSSEKDIDHMTAHAAHGVYRITQQLLSPVFSRFLWPWEFGSGNVSLATKCITVVLPKGSFNAMGKAEGSLSHTYWPTEITSRNWNHLKNRSLSAGLPQQTELLTS